MNPPVEPTTLRNMLLVCAALVVIWRRSVACGVTGAGTGIGTGIGEFAIRM